MPSVQHGLPFARPFSSCTVLQVGDNRNDVEQIVVQCALGMIRAALSLSHRIDMLPLLMNLRINLLTHLL